MLGFCRRGINSDIRGFDDCANYGVVVGGQNNEINHALSNTSHAFIGGGCTNSVYGSCFSALVGGGNNNICTSCYSFIGGGRYNEIVTLSCSGVIGGGYNNCIVNSACNSGILGGQNNTINGHDRAFIIGCGITSTANNYTFMNNSCTFGVTRTGFLVETSAKKHKECILPLESQVENIKKLEPVSFTWKEDKKEDIGLIAEDVEKVLPKLVSYEDNGELHGVKYSKITAVLIKAFQEQQKQIDELKEEIKQLKQ